MRKIFSLFVLSVFFHSCLVGQDTINSLSNTKGGARFIQEFTSEHSSLDCSAGMVNCDFSQLNQSLESSYGSRIDSRVTSVGITYKGNLQAGSQWTSDALFSVQYYLPEKISFNDSLSFISSGYQIGAACCKDIFSQAQHFDLLAGAGFSVGRLALNRQDDTYASASGKYTNPFFSPKVIVEPRVLFGTISLAFRSEYLFDISKYGWHRKTDGLPLVGKAAASGLSAQIVLGFRLKN